MNNLIISFAHYVGVFALVFFAWAGSAFAAPVVAPLGVSTITETTATFTGHAFNGARQLTVWYELGEAGSPLAAYSTRAVHGDSVESFYVTGLKAGTTYSARFGAMDGADIVYSPLTTFTTKGVAAVPVGTVTTTQTATGANVVHANTSVASAQTGATQTTATPQTKIVATKSTSSKNVAVKTNTNTQSAALIGAGDMFPQTLVGWVVLIILVLVAVLVTHMIVESNDRRKARRTLSKPESEHAQE